MLFSYAQVKLTKKNNFVSRDPDYGESGEKKSVAVHSLTYERRKLLSTKSNNWSIWFTGPSSARFSISKAT